MSICEVCGRRARPLRDAHAPARRRAPTRRSRRRSARRSARGFGCRSRTSCRATAIDSSRRCLELVDGCRRGRARRRVRHAHAALRDDLPARGAAAMGARRGSGTSRGAPARAASTRAIERYESILSAGGDWNRIVLLDNDDLARIRPARPRVDRCRAGPGPSRRRLRPAAGRPLPERAADGHHPLPTPRRSSAKPSAPALRSGLRRDDDRTGRAARGPVFHGAYTWAAWYSASASGTGRC